MSEVKGGAVKLIGLPVVHGRAGDLVGTVTDAAADESGELTHVRVRMGWLAGDRCLPADQFQVGPDSIHSSQDRDELEQCGAIHTAGLVGVQVHVENGELLGKISNVLVEPGERLITGLELSNGLVKDLSRGRSLVVLESESPLGAAHNRSLVLPEAGIRVLSEKAAETPPAASEPAGGMPPLGVSPIDWDRVAALSEEQIREEMARVVWERHGSPRDGVSPDHWSESVAPWAAALKAAESERDPHAFEDVAILSDDQVEALRVFRVGRQHPDRSPRESGPPLAVQTEQAA